MTFIKNVCNILGLSCSTGQHTLNRDLNMGQISTKFVSTLLKESQKQDKHCECKQLQNQVKNAETSFLRWKTSLWLQQRYEDITQIEAEP